MHFQKINNLEIEAIYSKAEKQLLAQLPFVIYKKPGEKSVRAFFQKNDFLYTFSQFDIAGFVFSPFDHKQPSVLFPLNESELYEADFKEHMTHDYDDEEFENHPRW